ncbi:MAG: DUF2057 domain-containing protein [Pseudomonadales bacterium]|nr:DUF2057 domain-containing protein [Pseudomonadales bacterium]
MRWIFMKLVVISALVASGCATKQHHVWYEGNEQAAVLKSKETVLIESIDGRKTDVAFIGQVHSYSLAPGEHVIVVTYGDLFEITADDYEKITSNPVKLTVNLEAGKTYQFDHKEVKKMEASREFSQKPVFSLMDTSTGKAQDLVVEYTTPRSILSRLRFESEQEQIFVSDYVKKQQATKPASADGAVVTSSPTAENGATTAKASGGELSPLHMLKFSWQQASPQERAAFLEWTQQ